MDVSHGPLAGRTAIVTGAGQGIGEGIARRLAREGANVVVAARRAETGEPVAASIRSDGGAAHCVPTDVEDRLAIEACVAATVERFGSLEIVVHNAFRGGAVHRLEDPDLVDRVWPAMNRTGVRASLWCAQVAAPHLLAAGNRGRLLLVTSPSGVEGSATRPLYTAAKAAQRAMAKSLARAWGASGVTVNCIAPVAETPALSAAFARQPELRSAIEARTALRRVGRPEADIGAVAAFLASDAAGYVTGQTIVCDGGSFTGL